MKKLKLMMMILLLLGILPNVVFADNETWTYCNASGNLPLGRYAHTGIYDKAHERMIIFGGAISGGQRVGDMWALDGSTLAWAPLSANNQGPVALAAHTAIYNPVDTTMVLFSGATERDWEITNKIWILNLNTLLWEQLPPVYPAPSPRMCAYTVYGPGNNQMLLFAGRDFDYRFNDMWIFDFGTRQWQQINYASTAPLLREGSHFTLIDDGDRLLISGGWNTCTDFFDDVWIYEFATNIWTPYSLPAPFAPGRAYHSIIYDGANDRALIFAGFNSYSGNGLNDLWELDLESMTFAPISPLGDIPAFRGRHSTIVGGFAGHLAAVFGGAHYFSQFHNDTYFLDWDIITGLQDVNQTPTKTSTLKCYPNPFNSQTELTFSIEKNSDVMLSIYNMLGQKVGTLIRDNIAAGTHSVIWDAIDMPSGIYFARLESGGDSRAIKMLLLK